METPSVPTVLFVDEKKGKSVAKQSIQDAGDETKGLLDLNIPWQQELETPPSSSSSFSFPSPPPEEQRPKKRKYPATQENAPIDETAYSRKYKTEATKNTQLCGCFSHCSPGDAPASVGGQDSDQVEEHQDQASPRNTANPWVIKDGSP